MAELNPIPLPILIRRMFHELETADAIFDLPVSKCFLGDAAHDFSVRFHGHRAATPLGPAAGPQSQLAQNIVLSWLMGGRIMELKTVQILDELEIPRPCIDMQTIGFNVEWSQELKLQQSLEEYVKAAMLVTMLAASGKLDVPEGAVDVIYDMSVGYDLKGIQTPEVQAFIDGMLDAGAVVERLRAQIPDDYAHLRDLDYPTRLADTLTLSTFHGCPPDEIEKIIDWLLRDKGLHCIVKLNPTLLGPDEVRGLLNESLGYEQCRVPDSAFEHDTKWDQAQGFIERLGETAAGLGLGFGVKFTNTLIVDNHRGFFPTTEQQMYLSGQPLHVIAMSLVRKLRRRFGDRYPISFSAGIDRKNFPDAVAVGLTPITVCSDLLKPGGYGRGASYLKELARRMDAAGAADVEEFIVKAYGHAGEALDGLEGVDDAARAACRAALDEGGDLRAAAGDAVWAQWVSACKLANTETYVARAREDARYSRAKNSKPPRKLGSMLELFDCVTCDKCIPVCPNDANFALSIAPREVPKRFLVPADGGWNMREDGVVALEQKHQIGNFADFCNECGNCDIFCPEDGGPYALKPRFFGTRAEWERYRATHDGFYVRRSEAGDEVWGRFDGAEYHLRRSGTTVAFEGEGFAVSFDPSDIAGTATGQASGEVDLTWWGLMEALREGVLDGEAPTWPRYVALHSS